MNQNSLSSEVVSESSEGTDRIACEIGAGISKTMDGIASSRMRTAVSALLNSNKESECTQAVSGKGLV